MWPFRKPIEVRQAPYTDAITAAIIAANSSSASTPNVTDTSAIEIAVGVIGRAFALAEVEGAVIEAAIVSAIARSLIIRGEAVFLYDGIELLQPASYEIEGSYRRETWRYTMEFPTPSGHTVSMVAGTSRVMHARYSFDAAQPWLGIGPLSRANLSGELQANMERALRDESSGAVGYLLPIPTGGDDDSVANLKADIKSLNGRTAVVETTAGGWGEGRLAAPSQDYAPKRIGPNPPDSMAVLHRQTLHSILAMIGVPVELVTANDGTGQREAWRRCLHGTIHPLAMLIQTELSRIYARSVRLGFDRLMASDIQGRARAFQSMVGGGMSVTEAAAQSGLLADE